jgi:predicted dehydrogenase
MDPAPVRERNAVAAGPTPAGTWITDPRAGGGRIVGEVCHFGDLCTYLVGTPPEAVFARPLGRSPEHDDSTVAMLHFPDGSTAAIEYLSRTSPGLPKKRFEASADGRTIRCENFRTTTVADGPRTRTWNEDKGQRAAVAAVIESARRGEPSPFGLDEIEAISRATFAILESVRTGRPVELVR